MSPELYDELPPQEAVLPEATIRDVASAAAVSVATVSNVLNHPHLVASATRKRVEETICRLRFQPNRHAKALRARGITSIEKVSLSSKAEAELGSVSTESNPRAANSIQNSFSKDNSTPQISELVGLRVNFMWQSMITTGIVDDVMPDGSHVWVWTDNGMGRRIVDLEDLRTF